MTTSFPGVGYGGLTADAWALTFDAHDGIIDDYVGNAFNLTLLNATNEGAITSGSPSGKSYVSNNGYTMTVNDDERVALPAPTSGSVTYYVGSLYDSDLNVAIPGSNPPQADPAGPCRLRAITGAGDLTATQRFLVLWQVTRTSAALSGAVKVDRRRWVGTTVDYADGVTDASPGNEGLYPRGTIRTATDRFVVRRPNPAGTALTWINPLFAGPFAFPFGQNMIARQGKTAVPQYYRDGQTISLEGQLQRSSGNLSNGDTVTLGQMPVGARPSSTRSYICKCGGSNNYTEVRVNSDGTTDGKVLMTDPPSSTTWIDLSPISYRIGA